MNNIAMEYLRQGYQILVTEETREGLSKMVGYIPTFSSSKRFHVVYMKNGLIETKCYIKHFKGFDKIIDGKKLLLTKKYERISIKYVKDEEYVYILEINNAVSSEEIPNELKEKYIEEEGAIYALRYGEKGIDDYFLSIRKKENGEHKTLYKISPAMRYKKQEFKEVIKYLKMAGERFSKLLKEYKETPYIMDIKEIKI